ncbi:MAG: CoA pyrophosphatase, partial [Myxococcota bacterium]|nr:CoA pyrophosphatase [Myxococcota bacterium]
MLVPLQSGPDGLELILTLRPSHLSSHAGQVSFPGGRVESMDTSRWETALRETREELGLSADQVTPLGELDDLATITHFHVTPCVALVQPEAQLAPAE